MKTTFAVLVMLCPLLLWSVSHGQRLPVQKGEFSHFGHKVEETVFSKFKADNSYDRVQSHESGYWSVMNTRNTGSNELSRSYVGVISGNAVFEDSQGRLYAISGGSVDIWDGQFWRHLDPGEQIPCGASEIVEDHNGDIWVGTGCGIVRFAPSLERQQLYDTQNADVNDSPVVSLLVDNQNRIWVGYQSGQLTLIENLVESPSSIAEGYISDIFQHSNGQIWLASSPDQDGNHGRLYVHDPSIDSTWSYDEDTSDLPHDEIDVMTEDANGNLWVNFYINNDNTKGGAARFDGTNWTYFDDSDGLPTEESWFIKAGNDGLVYYSTRSTTMAYDGSSWSTVSNNNSRFPLNGVGAITNTHSGDIVFGAWSGSDLTGGGLHIKSGSKWTYRSPQNDNGLPHNAIFAVAEDTSDNIWVGGFYGVARYDGSNWTYFNVHDGMANSYAWKIHGASDGKVWFGTTQNGVTYYENDAFTVIDQYGTFAETIFEDTQGNIWLGSYDGNGVLQYDGSSFIHHPHGNGLIGNVILAFAEDANGNIYAATSAGVARYDGSSWSEFAVDGITGTRATEIANDADGNLYIALDDGTLRIYDGSNWMTHTTGDGYAGWTTHIEASSDGSVWFSGRNVQVLKDGHWTTFLAGNGLPRNTGYDIQHLSDGSTLVGTYFGGLAKYAKTQPLVLDTISDNPDDEGGWLNIEAHGYLLDPWRVSDPQFTTTSWTVWRQNGNNWESAATTQVNQDQTSNTVSVAVPTTRATGADSGATYRFKLTAHNHMGTVLGTSNIETAYALDNRAPAQVQNVTHQINDNDDVVLEWDAVSANDLANYQVFEWDGNSYDPSSPVTTTTSTSATLTDPNAPGKDYVVVAKDRHNNFGEASDPHVVTSLGITDLPKVFELGLTYPNPFNPTALVPFTLPSAAHVRIELFNTVGNRVAVLGEGQYAAGTHSVQLNGSQLSSGMYLIRARLGEKSFQQKVTLVK